VFGSLWRGVEVKDLDVVEGGGGVESAGWPLKWVGTEARDLSMRSITFEI
jgi:hypothetical protein